MGLLDISPRPWRRKASTAWCTRVESRPFDESASKARKIQGRLSVINPAIIGRQRKLSPSSWVCRACKVSNLHIRRGWLWVGVLEACVVVGGRGDGVWVRRGWVWVRRGKTDLFLASAIM